MPDEKSVFAVKENRVLCFGHVCSDANVPLYLVNELVDIVEDECDRLSTFWLENLSCNIFCASPNSQSQSSAYQN